MPEPVRQILHILEENGYEAYAVGGCVRDTLLGRKPEDWDITTSAKPPEVKRIFRNTIDTGIQHGTVTVMVNHVGYEVTTYRIDGEYEDGRHPREVEFTGNLKMDLERRDFTINAMAYNESVGLVDEFHGMDDLQRGVIRCVGDAGQRFDEDALRMLRAVRFAGQLQFAVEESTKKAICQRAKNLSRISSERIRTELTKLLVSPGAERLWMAYETGLTAVFLPEFDNMALCEQENPHHIYTVGKHSLQSVCCLNDFGRAQNSGMTAGLSREAREWIQTTWNSLDKKHHMMLAVTMLFHDIAKPLVKHVDKEGIAHFYGHPAESEKMTKQILRRLTFDNETIDTVCRLIRWHDYRFASDIRSIRRAVSKIGRDIAQLLFLVQYADILAQNPEGIPRKGEEIYQAQQLYRQICLKEQPLSVKELAVNGRDLMQAGIQPGPQLGAILKRFLELVLEEPERNRKEYLLKQDILDKVLQETCISEENKIE